MKWGITGGSGQLSRSLIDQLESQGQAFEAWSHHDLDVSKPESVNTIANSNIKVLINCAAWTNVDGAEDAELQANLANRDGALNMALAAKKLGVPLIHISTDYVFSGNNTSPWKVEDETHPTSKYGLSKLLGEISIEQNFASYYILRTAWLYGPYGKNFAKTILRKALTTKDEIKVVNDQKGQPTSTVDLAKHIFKIVNSDAPFGIYHATNSGSATWWEFARELFTLARQDPERVIPVSSSEFPSKVKRPAYSVLDHSKWGMVGIEPMHDWRAALHEIFPEIKSAVERELSVV
ncbi:MAG: dTDP-4-dehydrorhamnose reductase [Actinomycetota bacterium]|jgi:dTDP-4-dehydrorhamnose reductase